ncbi:hypothetical protein DPMN_030752 [Dreissena polymorpha]|uniref:Secreted protein n=1 Tax=Dreissena polymorpha TaxID=45954 RepID=A0A9D4LYQ3_DREPO|nr:hypothetical protein DPMN_030752 [Dreissena polymorpha]
MSRWSANVLLRMLSQLSIAARHSRSALVCFKSVKANAEPFNIRLIRVMANTEPAQNSAATFQISIRLKSIRVNAEPAQHSSATF